MILCSLRYCRFPPKYIANSINMSKKNGFPLMCGKCVRQRKDWLEPWCSFITVNDPIFLDISKAEYYEGIELKIYPLSKNQIKTLKELVV